MDQELQKQLVEASSNLIQILYKLGFAVFIVLLFKDMMSDFAQNVFLYLKMRLDKKSYTAEGGKVKLNGEKYIIIDIAFGYVHLRKMNNGERCRMTTKDYWNSRIFYYDDRGNVE
jgi:hypothetical protein